MDGAELVGPGPAMLFGESVHCRSPQSRNLRADLRPVKTSPVVLCPVYA